MDRVYKGIYTKNKEETVLGWGTGVLPIQAYGNASVFCLTAEEKYTLFDIYEKPHYLKIRDALQEFCQGYQCTMLKNPNHIYGPSGLMVPEHLNFGDFMLEKMWQFKDNVLMIDASTHKTITYGEVLQQAINFAISLSHMRVRKGDVMAIMSENRMEFWGPTLGAVCAGAAVAGVSPTYMKEELKHALNIPKPKILICSPAAYKNHEKTLQTLPYLEKIIVFGDEKFPGTLSYNDLAVNVKEDVKYESFMSADVNGQIDTAVILYSSGTTGLPKGVMLTHLNLITACCTPIITDPKEKNLAISPWYHSMGMVGFFLGTTTGRTNVFMPKFELDLYLRTIERYKISQLTVVPPVIVAVCKWPAVYDLSSVKMLYSGAAPLHKETADEACKKFPNLVAVLQGYGASETTLGVIKFSYKDVQIASQKVGSVGTVVPGTTIKIADVETRKALGPNERGEICVKGSMIMKGYFGIQRGDEFDDEGFYKTGDIGYYDEDGFFYVVDRLKELIKYKGFQVPPAELEALLLTHPAVKDVGVIGIPHASGGEVPLAYVVGASVTEKDLQDFVAERLSNPKHLRGGVRFVDQIPKSPSGKILRKDLRLLYKSGKSKL